MLGPNYKVDAYDYPNQVPTNHTKNLPNISVISLGIRGEGFIIIE